MGVARPVGKRRRLRLPAGVGRQPRHQSRGPSRRDLDLPRGPRGSTRQPLALARGAPHHPVAPDGERRVDPVRLLHDLRPEDDARFAGRPIPVRGACGARRSRRPVLAVPDQWAPVVSHHLLARGPADRPFAAGPALPVEIDRYVTGGKEPRMKPITTLAAVVLTVALTAPAALAFCGFYVAKADTKLFNQASQVVLVRYEDKTVITMANDFKGDPKEFAIVVPVPVILEKGQIRIGDRALIEHLDAYSSPRLVEYFDEDPCSPRLMLESKMSAQRAAPSADAMAERARGLGVTIEARYTVGEYDILILSAKESAGLETWLRDSGYRLPAGASSVLGSYLKQGMKFFVARVNLKEQARLGFTYLRPLQMAFESPKFMLPIRLGTLNADGQQELFVYALTRKGRVETTNYRTVRLPTGMDLPVYVKEEFPQFYRAMFAEQVKREAMRAVFLEYAWDMSWCDPCAAQPLSPEELRKLGVFWLPEPGSGGFPDRFRRLPSGPVDVFVTRLHVRYDAAHFPEDLVFQETADRSSFQGRYVLRHPWKGEAKCEAAEHYRRSLRARGEQEAGTLATLTGWPIEQIRRKAGTEPDGAPDNRRWWQRLFGE